MIPGRRIAVLPGDGLVATFGSAVVVAFPRRPAEQPFVQSLLQLVQASATDAALSTGRKLARRLVARLAEADPDAVPAFGLLASEGEDVVVVLHGAVRLVGDGEEPVRLSGTEVATWVDRVLRAPGPLTVEPEGQTAAAPAPWSDLRLGAVPGGGIAVVPAEGEAAEHSTADMPLEVVPTGGEPPVPVPRAEPDDDPTVLGPVVAAAPAEPSSEFVAVSLLAPDEEEDEEVAREPLPIPGEAVAAEAPEEGAFVEGVRCSRGHLNDPNALYCSACGISMVQSTHELVRGPRPPLGVLVLDDGATFALDCNYVIGREPEEASEVRDGSAHSMRLADPQRTLSRVHARVVLDGWEVRVGDAGSSNGTFVAAPGEAQWNRLPPGTLTTIRPGTRVLAGHRVLVFDSHHRV